AMIANCRFWIALGLALWLLPRGGAQAQVASPANKASDATVSKSQEKLRSTLDKQLTWNFDAAPLSSVVRKLREQTGLDIVIDDDSLEDAGLTTDLPLSLKARKLSLRAGL